MSSVLARTRGSIDLRCDPPQKINACAWCPDPQDRSWDEIGAALGISWQAAWKQFGADVRAILGAIHDRNDLTEDEAMQLAKR